MTPEVGDTTAASAVGVEPAPAPVPSDPPRPRLRMPRRPPEPRDQPTLYERDCNRCGRHYRGVGRLLCDACRDYANQCSPLAEGFAAVPAGWGDCVKEASSGG